MDILKLSIVYRSPKKKELIQICQIIADEVRLISGCLGCSVFKDSEEKNRLVLEVKWTTLEELTTFFKSENFSALYGAMKFLGEQFEISINNSKPSEGFAIMEFARTNVDVFKQGEDDETIH